MKQVVYIFIKIDFDRDAAFPMKEAKYAISKPLFVEEMKKNMNPEKAVSIEGTKSSFPFLVTYLVENNLPATFFLEARTASIFFNLNPESLRYVKNPLFDIGVHGYDHEDLTGKETGIKFSQWEEERVLSEAKNKIEKIFNKKVNGFRAPYMRLSNNTLNILDRLGFTYDSSLYYKAVHGIQPYKIRKRIIEFPVIKTPKDSNMKGMYTYLWPLFEKKRSLGEIIDNYSSLIKNTKNKHSFISINLHSWHFSYNISEERYLTKKEVETNAKSFVKLIQTIQKIENVVFSTPKQWIIENRDQIMS
ncbi:MAG: polysaccharide deacetylase family protein [Candidatus Heimdallarchaeaceae archaeon]